MFALDGDYWSGVAQDHYESRIIEEARAIVAGKLDKTPTVEHLRVALAWLDGTSEQEHEQDPRPF